MSNSFPQHWQEILDCLPPLSTRKQIAAASGGLIAAGTLANLDSQGRGIPERRIIGKRTCYPREAAVRFLMGLERGATNE